MTGRREARDAGSTLLEPRHPDPTSSSRTLPDATHPDPSPAASKDPTAP
jgi:hypothetical protein